MNVGIIDIGISNIGSLKNSIEKLGCSAICSADSSELASCEKLILPGVGAFGMAMDELESRGIDKFIRNYVRSGGHILGICLGMQLFMDSGFEGGRRKGLQLVRGEVVPLSKDIGRIPHIGWNNIYINGTPMLLMKGIEDGSNVYFVHSYYCNVVEEIPLVYTDFYGSNVVAGFQKDGVFGVQFHPEKSQVVGKSILKNFLEL